MTIVQIHTGYTLYRIIFMIVLVLLQYWQWVSLVYSVLYWWLCGYFDCQHAIIVYNAWLIYSSQQHTHECTILVWVSYWCYYLGIPIQVHLRTVLISTVCHVQHSLFQSEIFGIPSLTAFLYNDYSYIYLYIF